MQISIKWQATQPMAMSPMVKARLIKAIVQTYGQEAPQLTADAAEHADSHAMTALNGQPS